MGGYNLKMSKDLLEKIAEIDMEVAESLKGKGTIFLNFT